MTDTAYYYPSPHWILRDSGWIKSLLLFFDDIAILLPNYMYGRHIVSAHPTLPVVRAGITPGGSPRVGSSSHVRGNGARRLPERLGPQDASRPSEISSAGGGAGLMAGARYSMLLSDWCFQARIGSSTVSPAGFRVRAVDIARQLCRCLLQS